MQHRVWGGGLCKTLRLSEWNCAVSVELMDTTGDTLGHADHGTVYLFVTDVCLGFTRIA